MSHHPQIIQADGPSGQRARLKGSGADIWEIIATLKDNRGDRQATAEYLSLKPSQVEAAELYYQDRQGEIDQLIRRNQEEGAQTERDLGQAS